MLFFIALIIAGICVGLYYEATPEKRSEINARLDRQAATVKNYSLLLAVMIFSIVVHLILPAIPFLLMVWDSGPDTVGFGKEFAKDFFISSVHLIVIGIWILIARRRVKAGRKIKRVPFAAMLFLTLLFGLISILKCGIIINVISEINKR